jgi:hypothetical protein
MAVGTGADVLRERWRAASLEAGWTVPGDWWVPAVDAVAEALGDGRDPTPCCVRLGRARAEAGVGVEEAFADLAALHTVLGPGGAGGLRSARGVEAVSKCLAASAVQHRPEAARTGIDAVPPALLRALAVGWAEVACAPAAASGCEDPMTGLVTPAYLRTRLGEVYREAERYGVPASAGWAFVVVEPGDPQTGEVPLDLARLGRALTVAECARAVFSGGETLCALPPTRVLALVVREPELASRVAGLRRLLADRLPATGIPVRAWVEGLPATIDAAHRLVDDLAR